MIMTMATNDMSDYSSSDEDEDVDLHDADEPMCTIGEWRRCLLYRIYQQQQRTTETPQQDGGRRGILGHDGSESEREKAELRRFKDGAIDNGMLSFGIRPSESSETLDDSQPYINFQSGNQVQGGIVERIVRHILHFNFLFATFWLHVPSMVCWSNPIRLAILPP
jgi:hypothetical protein